MKYDAPGLVFDQRISFKLLALKLLIPPEGLIRNHYVEHMGKPLFESFVTCQSPLNSYESQ